MQGTEAIINKIISDAELKAKEIVENAESYAKTKKKQADLWVENYLKVQDAELNKEAAETVNRRIIVANLDVRKLTLKYKQDLIGEVLDGVYKKMCSMSKSDYSSFVQKLIIENADDEDEILLSKDGVLSNDSVSKFSIVKEKNLIISKKLGDFTGGIMLIGKKCDKDLTFKSIIEEKKYILTSVISEKLFKDQ